MEPIYHASPSTTPNIPQLSVESTPQKKQIEEEQITDTEDHSDSWESLSDADDSVKHILLEKHKQKIHKLEKQFQKNAAGEHRNTSRILNKTLADKKRELKKLNKELEAKKQEMHVAEGQRLQNQIQNPIQKNANTGEGQKISRFKSWNYVVDPAHSPLQRINSYFNSLMSENIIKQTILQLLTGIVLRNKKAGQPLSNLLDQSTFEAYELVEDFHYSNDRDRYIENPRENLIKHYNRIEKCLEDIGPSSYIGDINEKIISEIEQRFLKNKQGEVVIRLKPEMEIIIKAYISRNKQTNNAFDEIDLISCCIALCFFTKNAPEAMAAMDASRGNSAIDKEKLRVDRELQKLAQKLMALYKRYDGLELRDINGSSLERINSYLDGLKYQNIVKQTILYILAGTVLHHKKIGEPVPNLPDEDVQEVYALINDSVRALDGPMENESDDTCLDTHYEKITACLKDVTQSGIRKINERIFETITKQFIKDSKVEISTQLKDEIRRFILRDSNYLKKKHAHNEACKAERATIGYGSILASMLDEMSIRDQVCARQEFKKLVQKLSDLYIKYDDLPRRQAIRSQKRPDRGPTNPTGNSSSGNTEALEYLEHRTASSSTPLLARRTA